MRSKSPSTGASAGLVMALLLITLGISISLGCRHHKPTESATPSPSGEWKFTMVSGNNQTVRAFDTLRTRLTVELLDASGEPRASEPILFQLTSGNGQVQAKPIGDFSPDEVKTVTDFSGRAATNFKNFGEGISTVEASVIARPNLKLTFTIHGTP